MVRRWPTFRLTGFRARSHLVSTIHGRRNAIGPGADHHVQAARAHGHPEQGGRIRRQFVSIFNVAVLASAVVPERLIQ